MKLTVTPVTIREACAYVDAHHRHHKAPQGALFAVAVSDFERVRGVAICGRPVNCQLQDGWTIEVTRVCTDGHWNACSMLYGAARRAAIALGFKRVITYTLKTEGGSSLRGAGFRVVADVRGETWNRAARPRVDTAPLQDKLRWQSGDER